MKRRIPRGGREVRSGAAATARPPSAQSEATRLASLAEIARLISSSSDLPAVLNNLAIALHDDGQLAEAEAAYQEALQRQPSFHTTHLNLSILFEEQGKLKEAERVLREAVRLAPDHAGSHFRLPPSGSNCLGSF